MYANGHGVPKDEAQSFAWYRKAADQGHARAQYNLGVIYAYGQGVVKDDAQAIAWFRKAAERGYALAQYNLGVMYEHGRGVAKDDAQAVAWYRKAADQGDADAQNNLGLMYANGRSVAKDDAQAVAWYRKAADQGDADAQYNLGLNYNKGEGVAKDEAQAVSWYRKAADQGYAGAELNLGVMYGKGQGVQQSYAQAALWFARAAQRGDDTAVRNLELAVDKLPTLRMRGSVPVRANPELTGTVVKTAAAGEVAYRLSQFDHWYEVYFRDRNIVGYINTSQASVVVAEIPQPAKSPIRKAAYVEPTSNFPAAPATRPGVTSCNTRCNNGQCLRTYDSGKHVAFQAEHKFNAFNNEWEWDPGTC
jgi:TPR repeat protein